MKIKAEHYQHIKNELASLHLPDVMAYKAKLQASGQYKDFNTRFMYDLQRAAGLLSFVCDTIYTYADDSHYQTALFKAGKELGFIN